MPKRTMPRTPRGRKDARSASFRWGAPWLGTIVHSHVPSGGDLDAARPLPEALPLGRRDALSLVGQFAAHLAFLRFAGIGNTAFDPSEWGLIKQRGRDPRLVRMAAGPPTGSDEMLPVTLVEQFSETVGAIRLDVLRRSWVRPESVYAEVIQKLASTAGDASSLTRSSWGAIRAPGPTVLNELFTRPGVTVLAEDVAAEAVASFGTAVTVLGADANPLEPWSGVRSLAGDDPSSEAELAERVVLEAAAKRPIYVIVNWAAFDPPSRKTVRLLIDAGDPLSWMLPRDLESLVPSHRQALIGEATRRFLLSTSVAAERELLLRFTNQSVAEFEGWCEEFVSSSHYLPYVLEGEVRDSVLARAADEIEEPMRSFVGALAMLGAKFSRASAESLLGQLGFPERIGDVVSTGVVLETGKGTLEFADEGSRRELLAGLGSGLRRSIARVAAELDEIIAEPPRRLALLIEAEQYDKAEREAIELRELDLDATLVVETLPKATSILLRSTPHVVAIRCKALIELGRYGDAAKEAAELKGSCGRFIRALILRRVGDYGSALDELGEVEDETCSFEEHLLSGELHRLKGHHDAARAAFQRSRKIIRDARDRGRLAYEEALLAFDCGMQGPEDDLPDNPYYEARYLFYEAAGDGSLASAIEFAREALRRARTVLEQVDAELDLVYGLFLAGDWESARQEARAALVLLEETQGDRAAAGILFTLAFLCADAGQWSQAEQKIERLQLFYDEREDERRARELDLLRAHLALGRLQLAEAQRRAESLLREDLSPEMREAAALILDEVSWMRGGLISPRSSGQSQCVELTNRHLMFVARTSHIVQHEIQNRFFTDLCRWEAARRKGKRASPPQPSNRTDELILLRSMIALCQRRREPEIEVEIQRLTDRLDVRNVLEDETERGAPVRELEILRLAATEPFPYDPATFGVDWRLISRTRTGRWSESGSLRPLAEEKAEEIIADSPLEWIRCGARTMFFIDGLESWTDGSRAALGALIETRLENQNLKRLVEPESASSESRSASGIVGESVVILDTIRRIEPASRRDVPVTIEGESGTGKELVARAIHDHSSRRGRAFTAVNCAALPENLIESELFGCVRGAFTGADRDRKGLIEATDEGTLFLDEIAEMALPAQAKLLRFLQEREFRRVGETVNRHADVRVIAATNRRLEDAVDRAEFRDDLYYRVRGIEISVPPLRERGSDVLLLAHHFLRSEYERHGVGPTALSEDVDDLLLSHGWPGNVRELQQTIRAAHALAGDSKFITADHLPDRLQKTKTKKVPRGSMNEEVTRFRRSLIERALDAASGNQSQAAKQLGVTRQALAYQIRELGILVEKRR